MEELKNLAKKFCEAEGIESTDLIENGIMCETVDFVLGRFVQFLIEKGEVVETDKSYTFNDMRESWVESQKNRTRESLKFKHWISKYKSTTESTVSSAVKELKTFYECRQEVIKSQGWASDMEFSGTRLEFIKISDYAAEMYANQFKSSPAKVISDEDIQRYITASHPDIIGTKPLQVLMAEKIRISMQWIREQLTPKSHE